MPPKLWCHVRCRHRLQDSSVSFSGCTFDDLRVTAIPARNFIPPISLIAPNSDPKGDYWTTSLTVRGRLCQGGGQKTDFVRVAALSARDWRCTARAPLSGTDRRLRPLCKKCRQTPILIAPVFPQSSPFSALAAQGPCWGRETRFRWLECRSRERIGAFRPSAKSVGRPLF